MHFELNGNDNMRESKLWSIEPVCISDKKLVREKSLENHCRQGCTGRAEAGVHGRVGRKKLVVKQNQLDKKAGPKADSLRETNNKMDKPLAQGGGLY